MPIHHLAHPTAFIWPFSRAKSMAVLNELAMCKGHSCRGEVAAAGGGGSTMKFVRDAVGTKWKCVERDSLSGAANNGNGYACIELDCRVAPHAPLDYSQNGGSFRYESNCTGVITNVDGAEVEGAPHLGADYDLVETLHKSCTMGGFFGLGSSSLTSCGSAGLGETDAFFGPSPVRPYVGASSAGLEREEVQDFANGSGFALTAVGLAAATSQMSSALAGAIKTAGKSKEKERTNSKESNAHDGGAQRADTVPRVSSSDFL